MADTDRTDVEVQDVWPVRSRVAWAPVFAGVVMALAAYLVFSLLGAAIGLTVGDDVDGQNLGRGAAIWALATLVLSLALGGWVAARCTAGETKVEAAMHGLLVWGLLFAMLTWLVTNGVQTGVSALAGVARLGGAAVDPAGGQNWDQLARQAGVPQEQIDQWQANLRDAPQNVAAAANDPQNQRQAAEAVAEGTWWTLGGLVLSMAAAIGGALLGAGPSLHLAGGRGESRVVYSGRTRHTPA